MERVRPLVLYHYFEKKEENTSDHHCDWDGVLVVSLNNYGPGPKKGDYDEDRCFCNLLVTIATRKVIPDKRIFIFETNL